MGRAEELPEVMRHGRTDVAVAVVSMSSRSPDRRDATYLEWHALDHLPEQHRIPGLRAGTRWVSTPACRAARSATSDRFDAVDHVVAYLFAEPVEPALDTFFALGADLRRAGRMPLRLPAVELAGYSLVDRAAAAATDAGADVLPWRPHRGVHLLVERGPAAHREALLDVPGVAGCWTYEGSSSLHERLAATDGLRLTISFLDGEPPAVADRLAPVLRERWERAGTEPLLAAPFVTVVPWAWDAALPH